MFIFTKKNGRVEEIYGLSIPLRCVPDEIVKVLRIEKNSNLYKVLMAVAECKVPAPGSGEMAFFAWPEKDGYINIHYARRKQPYSTKEQEIGLYLTGFQGNQIGPDEVKNYIIEGILHASFSLMEDMQKIIQCIVNDVFLYPK